MKIHKFLILTLMFGASLFADQLGMLKGVVINEVTRQPIVGANVFLVGTNLGTASDENGFYRIENVPAGTYMLRTDYIGYRSQISSDVVIIPARPTTTNIDLQESVVELNEAVVIADYFVKKTDSPTSTQTQSREEIRRLPGGFEDVIRAISILPGVAQVDPGRNDLIVRGGAPSENLYLVDNIEVPNINHFGTQGASGGPQSFINLDFVEETSFSTGGFSTSYGDRLSSVLDISLREGEADQLLSKTTISASQFGFNLEGGLTEKGNFIFSARRSYLDFLFKAAGFGFVPEYWDFLSKATFNINQTDQLTVLVIVALNKIKWFNDTADQRDQNSRILGSNQDQIVTGITYRHLMQSGVLMTSLSQINVEYDFSQRDVDLTPIFLNHSYDRQTSFKVDGVWRLSKALKFSMGGKINRIDFYSNMLLNEADLQGFGSLNFDEEYESLGYKTGIYAQLAKRHFKLNYSLGARVDHFSIINADPVVSPRLSVNYQFNGDLSLNMSLGRYNQYPSTVWLVAEESNRSLDPIEANQLVIGAEYLWRSDTKVSLEAYVKDYSNYPVSLTRPHLVMVNTGAGFGGAEEGYASFGVDPLRSEGTGRARGLEFFMQKKMSEVPFYGTFSLSYNQAKFIALDGVERQGSFDQTWIINFGGGYIINKKWEVSSKFRYATGRPYTPYNSNGQQDFTAYNSMRIDASHSLDMRVDRRWNTSNWGIITYIDIQNIYNRKPPRVPIFDRNTGEFSEGASLGILPTIGISAEI